MGKLNAGPMLNVYPDSLGGTLGDVAAFLRRPEVRGAFSSLYVLPSLFHSDLDRGFSVIDYGLNGDLAKPEDLEALRELGVDLKLDFVLNHASVRSPQFQDLLKRGKDSPYRDFFIDWNRFWAGRGEMTAEGYIRPREEYIRDMFFRKPGLPILLVRFPDGSEAPYWNTFYQRVWEEAGERRYLGQMDLNIRSPQVWEFYRQTLRTLSGYGAAIVRLDAFAYAPKEPGRRNFLNEPETWELLEDVDAIAAQYGLALLPEIHASYGEGCYEAISKKGYLTYDFFLPSLLIDALESGSGAALAAWAGELTAKRIRTVNMLGCHDGIPLLDLKGLLPEARIEALRDVIMGRGGIVKDLHGRKNMYYQVNASYFSALGEREDRLLLARALQLFMPGKPQVWYLDLFAGANDFEAVRRAGPDGHKEINRTNLSREDVARRTTAPVVSRQLELLRFRAGCPAFDFDSDVRVEESGGRMSFVWTRNGYTARLDADLRAVTYAFSLVRPDGGVETI